MPDGPDELDLTADWPVGPDRIDASHAEAMYRTAHTSSRYHFDGIKAAMPIADDSSEDEDDATSVVTLCREQCRRVLRVDAERVGKWPVMPGPAETYEDADLRGTLLDHWEHYYAPMLAGDNQTFIYRCSAFYVYALNRAPSPIESVRVGVLPLVKLRSDEAEAGVERRYLWDTRLNP